MYNAQYTYHCVFIHKFIFIFLFAFIIVHKSHWTDRRIQEYIILIFLRLYFLGKKFSSAFILVSIYIWICILTVQSAKFYYLLFVNFFFFCFVLLWNAKHYYYSVHNAANVTVLTNESIDYSVMKGKSVIYGKWWGEISGLLADRQECVFLNITLSFILSRLDYFEHCDHYYLQKPEEIVTKKPKMNYANQFKHKTFLVGRKLASIFEWFCSFHELFRT